MPPSLKITVLRLCFTNKRESAMKKEEIRSIKQECKSMYSILCIYSILHLYYYFSGFQEAGEVKMKIK